MKTMYDPYAAMTYAELLELRARLAPNSPAVILVDKALARRRADS